MSWRSSGAYRMHRHMHWKELRGRGWARVHTAYDPNMLWSSLRGLHGHHIDVMHAGRC